MEENNKNIEFIVIGKQEKGEYAQKLVLRMNKIKNLNYKGRIFLFRLLNIVVFSQISEYLFCAIIRCTITRIND